MDSSQNRKKVNGHLSGSEERPVEMDQREHLPLQDPVWMLTANIDDKVMMTYELPLR